MSCRRLFCNMVSLTAAKTYLIFSVSVAVVKWWKSARSRFRRTLSNMSSRKHWTSLMSRGSPPKWGKYRLKSECGNFSLNRSVLLRKRMIETSLKHLLFTMVSKILQLSSKRGVLLSSTITWTKTAWWKGSGIILIFDMPPSLKKNKTSHLHLL